MDEDHTDKMVAIKELVERGDYQVDAAAVADAILRRFGMLEYLPERPSASQKACSYPANGRS